MADQSLDQLLDKQSGMTISQVNSIAGAKGGKYLTTGSTLTMDCVGFVSWDDATVISVLTDLSGTLLTATGLTAIAIPKGMLVTFGTLAKTIAVSAGKGWVIRG